MLSLALAFPGTPLLKSEHMLRSYGTFRAKRDVDTCFATIEQTVNGKTRPLLYVFCIVACNMLPKIGIRVATGGLCL